MYTSAYYRGNKNVMNFCSSQRQGRVFDENTRGCITLSLLSIRIIGRNKNRYVLQHC